MSYGLDIYLLSLDGNINSYSDTTRTLSRPWKPIQHAIHIKVIFEECVSEWWKLFDFNGTAKEKLENLHVSYILLLCKDHRQVWKCELESHETLVCVVPLQCHNLQFCFDPKNPSNSAELLELEIDRKLATTNIIPMCSLTCNYKSKGKEKCVLLIIWPSSLLCIVGYDICVTERLRYECNKYIRFHSSSSTYS